MTISPNSIIQGDALEVLKTFPDELVQTVVTSPPYWGLRDYGVDGQLGLEKTPEEYVEKMVNIFREVKRVLKSDGTLWLNLGDSYVGSWGNYHPTGKGGQRDKSTERFDRKAYSDTTFCPPGSRAPIGMKKKDLVGIPWMVAFALRAAGWYLRQDIIWHKPNPMPESVRDRCTKAHEYIFLLSKNEKYYYDYEVIKEPASWMTHERRGKNSGIGFNTSSKNDPTDNRNNRKRVTPKAQKSPRGWNQGEGSHHTNTGRYPKPKNNKSFDAAMSVMPEKRNKRSVWSVNPQPFPEAHFATFPEELIKPCILAGARARDIVFDPFMGSGTVALTAQNLNRKYLGIELNPEYIKISDKRLQQIRCEI